MRKTLLALPLLLAAAPALADGDERFPPVADATTKTECGACHMAYQPQMLPRRSWRALMAGLDDHFGENASLAEDTRSHIEAYLTANAAETSRAGQHLTRGLDSRATPLRISALPRWKHEHEEREVLRMKERLKVATWAACQVCHRGAEQGYYDDD